LVGNIEYLSTPNFPPNCVELITLTFNVTNQKFRDSNAEDLEVSKLTVNFMSKIKLGRVKFETKIIYDP